MTLGGTETSIRDGTLSLHQNQMCTLLVQAALCFSVAMIKCAPRQFPVVV